MDISSDELLRRKNTLKQFEDYFENITNTLNNFVEQIGWIPDKLPNNDVLVKCPLNSEHRILPSKLEVHLETCKLKKSGYDSTHSLYPSYYTSSSSAQTIKIDEITQMQVLKSAYEDSNFTLNVKHEPREVSQSIERYVCDFTSDERRILYNYAVENTKLSNHEEVKNDVTSVDFFNKNNEKPKSELELLQEQRDLKRRRAAYRGKRVHSDRKSYVEVLREVVEGLTKNMSHQEDKSLNVETSNYNAETVSNNRVTYKYGGNRNYSGNPYTRWLDIDIEESKLSKDCERKSIGSYSKVSPSGIYKLKDLSDDRKSRGRRRSSSEFKYKRSRRSRSRSKFRETKYSKSKKSKTPSKMSRETIKRKYRSRSRSISSKHKRSKRHKTRSKSKETIFKKSGSQSTSIEIKHKLSKRHRTRSKSKESSSGKKLKVSKSPINVYNLPLSNEDHNSIKINSTNSRNDHKKKKHKHKRKHSKSSKKLHKTKKDKNFEDCKNFDDIDQKVHDI